MAVIVYSLDRSTNYDNLPFAEVVNVQKYRLNEKPVTAHAAHRTSPPPSATSNPPSHCNYLQARQARRYPMQTSLSSALNPAVTMASSYTHASIDPMML